MSKDNYTILKKQTENDLRNYPLWIISLDAENLGYPSRMDFIKSKTSKAGSYVEDLVIDEVEKYTKVFAIERMLDILPREEKEFTERYYFRNEALDRGLEGFLKDNNMSKNKMYKLKNKVIQKFMTAFGYK